MICALDWAPFAGKIRDFHNGGIIIDRKEKTILSLACAGHSLSHTYMLIIPPLLPQVMNQFDLNLAQVSLMVTIGSFLFGGMALPGGILADKWGYKTVLAMFFIGTPAAACAVGSARSPLGLGIGLALVGLFGSLYHPSGLAMISHGVKERGKALGFHGMAGNLGIALSPIIAGGLALYFSWRHAYYFLSLPGFAAGTVFLLASRALTRDEQRSAVSQEASEQNTSDRSRQRLSVQALIVLYIAMAFTGFCYRGVVTMLPTYLGRFGVNHEFQNDLDNGVISESLREEFRGNKVKLSQDATVSVEMASHKWRISDAVGSFRVMKERDRLNVYGRGTAGRLLFATMVYLVGMLGQYMGGHLSDKRRKTRLYLFFNAASLPFMLLIGLAPGMLIVFAAALFAPFHFANQPVENGLVAQYTPPHLRSSSYGLKFFVAFGFGSFGAVFSGYVASRFGFNSVFLALGGVIFLVVLIVSLLNIVAREERVETSE